MQGKHTSDDLAKSIYRFKHANPDYANSAIARIFSISESTFRGILKRRNGQKKSIGSNFLPFCLQPDDLSPMLRHTVFCKNRDIRNRVAVQDVLTNAQKDRVNWCRRHLFLDFTKSIFGDD